MLTENIFRPPVLHNHFPLRTMRVHVEFHSQYELGSSDNDQIKQRQYSLVSPLPRLQA